MSGEEPKNFIEINGNKYDADTGRLISGNNTAGKKPATKPGIIDGVARRPGAIYKPVIMDQSATTKPSKINKSAKKSNHVSRKPSKSTILMRPSVKRPKSTSSTKSTSKTPSVSPGVPEARLKRAEETKKSNKISRFIPHHTKSTVVKLSQPLAVAHKKQIENARPKEDLASQFEKAIENASSHLEEFAGLQKDTAKRRRFALVTITLSVVVVSAVLLYQAVPMAKVKVAGTRAGFSASLPNYSPAGFGLEGDVEANSGEVSLNYKSRTDDKTYNITQAPSDWNSQSLVNNFLLPAGKEFQTYESSGTTIYVYDGSNATWVNGGIWYVLEGNASLTSDQLLRIANGL